MSLAEQPIRVPRKRLPSAPSIAVLEDHVAALKAEATAVEDSYRWLHASGYVRPRKGSSEKVRRDISGAGGGLDEGYAGLDMVRRQLEIAGDNVKRALELLGGASSALGRAQGLVDVASTPAIDTTPAVTKDKPLHEVPEYLRPMTPSEARAQQTKRNARAAERKVPWAIEEVTG